MLLWLNGNTNNKGYPNENYGREMLELFTLGQGRGYNQDDVVQNARALTGWTNDWSETAGPSTSASIRNCTTTASRRSSATSAAGTGATAGAWP